MFKNEVYATEPPSLIHVDLFFLDQRTFNGCGFCAKQMCYFYGLLIFNIEK